MAAIMPAPEPGPDPRKASSTAVKKIRVGYGGEWGEGMGGHGNSQFQGSGQISVFQALKS